MNTVWFVTIAVLWLGYVFLEGFDFGVGMLQKWLPRDERERRAMLETIGPVWDGNEVWLITAIGATFAAFPLWYAALLSTLYIPLLLVLLGLIMRGVALEYRGELDDPRWQRLWSWTIFAGSLLPSLGVGFLLAATATGLPLNAHGDRVGGPLAAVSWPAALGALAVAGFALLHGTAFVALKTDGEIRLRARRFGAWAGWVAVLPMLGFLLLVQSRYGSPLSWVIAGIAALAAVVALVRLATGAEGQVFLLLAVFAAGAVGSTFLGMYPLVLPSTLDPAWSLTVQNASSSPYTLRVMTWVAAFGLPLVLAYQTWTYWVFRKRVTAAPREA
jgi:cytochrome d ubiquinol oxidase subunit II